MTIKQTTYIYRMKILKFLVILIFVFPTFTFAQNLPKWAEPNQYDKYEPNKPHQERHYQKRKQSSDEVAGIGEEYQPQYNRHFEYDRNVRKNEPPFDCPPGLSVVKCNELCNKDNPLAWCPEDPESVPIGGTGGLIMLILSGLGLGAYRLN